MLKVAIVGNIASGKSTVENILETKGFKVFDTDKISHKILESSKEVKEVFGTTNRVELAKIVFSDNQKLKTLESIIHPKVKQELEKIFLMNYNLVFVSVPQLFESGFDILFDKIIYITADENVRLNRLIKRNSYTLEEAQKRINAQEEGQKREKADFIIENNSDFSNLESQVEKILSILV